MRHAQVQFEFRFAAGAGIGDHANEGPRLVVEPRPGPQIAEHVFDRDIEKFLHYRVGVDALAGGLDRGVAHQLPPLRHALLVKLALRHLVLLIIPGAILPTTRASNSGHR